MAVWRAILRTGRQPVGLRWRDKNIPRSANPEKHDWLMWKWRVFTMLAASSMLACAAAYWAVARLWRLGFGCAHRSWSDERGLALIAHRGHCFDSPHFANYP